MHALSPHQGEGRADRTPPSPQAVHNERKREFGAAAGGAASCGPKRTVDERKYDLILDDSEDEAEDIVAAPVDMNVVMEGPAALQRDLTLPIPRATAGPILSPQGQRSASSSVALVVPAKRSTSVEAARPTKMLRLSPPPSQRPPAAASLQRVPDSPARRSPSPPPHRSPSTQVRSPSRSYPSPTSESQDLPRILLKHPSVSNVELRARVPTRPLPISVYPPQFHFHSTLLASCALVRSNSGSQDAPAAVHLGSVSQSPSAEAPELHAAPTKDGFALPPPKSNGALHIAPTQFDAELAAPQNKSLLVRRRTSSVSLLARPTPAAATLSSPPRPAHHSSPTKLTTIASDEEDDEREAREQYWRDMSPGPDLHLQPPLSAREDRPKWEARFDPKVDPKCKGYEWREVGAAFKANVRFAPRPLDEMDVDGIYPPLRVLHHEHEIVGMGGLWRAADGKEEWKGQVGLPTRSMASSETVARVDKAVKAAEDIEFGYATMLVELEKIKAEAKRKEEEAAKVLGRGGRRKGKRKS